MTSDVALTVTVLGCSGSFAGPDSPASGYLVTAVDETGPTHLVMDLGNGAFGTLQRHIRPCEIDAIALSHLHPDHYADLSGLYVAHRYCPEGSFEGQTPVYGPPGTLPRLDEMYGLSEPETMASEFDVTELVDREPFTVGPMTVTPFAVNHPVPAFGFRVEAGGRVLSYSGDTDDAPALDPLLAGAHLALVDSAFVDGRDEVRDVHLSGSRAAQACVRAGGVERLVLTHIPAWNDPEVCRAQAAEHWPGEVGLAEVDLTYAV